MNEYERMEKILKDSMALAEELQQKPLRRDQQNGYRIREQTKTLSQTFIHYLGQNGYRFDEVRAAFGKIVEH